MTISLFKALKSTIVITVIAFIHNYFHYCIKINDDFTINPCTLHVRRAIDLNSGKHCKLIHSKCNSNININCLCKSVFHQKKQSLTYKKVENMAVMGFPKRAFLNVESLNISTDSRDSLYHTITVCSVRISDYDLAEESIKRIKSSFWRGTATSVLAEALCENGKLENAVALILQIDDIVFRRVAYTGAIDGMIKAGKYDQAIVMSDKYTNTKFNTLCSIVATEKRKGNYISTIHYYLRMILYGILHENNSLSSYEILMLFRNQNDLQKQGDCIENRLIWR